jgi:hypothetical protein
MLADANPLRQTAPSATRLAQEVNEPDKARGTIEQILS